MANALDFVVRHGWCATRYLPGKGCYLTLPELPKKPTKQQVDRIFDAMIKHDISCDTSALL